MKNILIITLLFISALATKADDYYDIPAGWDKVVEFDSTNNVLMFLAENNKILYYVYFTGVIDSAKVGWHYSNDFGKTFSKLNTNFNTALGHAFLYKGKLCYFGGTANGFYLFRYDLEKNVVDSVNVTKPVGGIVSKIYINEIDNTIIFKITNPASNGEFQLCFISQDGGENWELLDLFRYDHRYNIYDFRFDMRTPGKWLYVATDSYDPSHGIPPRPQPDRFFLTENNGKTFKELLKPKINITGIGEYSYETDTLDKYLSLDFESSIRSALKTKISSNPKYYYQSGFVIKDVLSNQTNISENLEQIIGNFIEKDTSKSSYLAIYQDYSTKYNQLILKTLDNFAFRGLANDSIYAKIILWDPISKIPIFLLKRNVKFIPNVSFDYSTKIIYVDKAYGNLYVEINKPSKVVQRRIIIRKKLQDPSNVEEELPIGNHFESTHIELFDILGRSIATFPSYEKLQAEIENYPPPHLIKWRDEKGISHFERMK